MINLLENGKNFTLLTRRRILGFIGISGVLIILGIIFQSGNVNLIDYSTGIAIGLTLALGTLIYFTFKPEIDKEIEKRRGISTIEANSCNVENKEETLDNALNEIRKFIKIWGKKYPWDTGYRHLIKHYQICAYPKRISEQAERLQKTIKPIKELKISGSKNALDNFACVADKLIELGADIEINCSSPTKHDPNHLRNFLKEGEQIIQDFGQVIKDLGKLRKKI